MSCKVWSRLNVTRKDGSEVKLRFQDYPWEKYKNEIIDFCVKHYMRDETFQKAAGIFKNEEAIAEYRDFFFGYFESCDLHITVCCFDDDSETIEILGLSMMCKFKDYKAKSSDEIDMFLPKTKEMQNFFHLIQLTSNVKNKDYQSCYEGRGITVRPDQRGLGIANEFVRLRKEICIDQNIDMTIAWMTALGSQKAAAKYGWKTFYEVSVEEMEKMSGLNFAANVPIFKVMYTTKD